LEKTPSRNHFPAKCLECAKSTKPFIHGKCSFCWDMNFQEEILCDLNRSTQNPTFFECHAFQPLLKLIPSSGQENRSDHKVESAETALDRLVNSDKVKYHRALALQKLASNPDDVILEIKYHFAWNVIGRRPVFASPGPMIDFISNTIMTCSKAVGGIAGLLWLAPDHIHLYVDSDGEVSPDNMAQELKKLSEAPIIDRFSNLIAAPRLWDEAYFIETLG